MGLGVGCVGWGVIPLALSARQGVELAPQGHDTGAEYIGIIAIAAGHCGDEGV